MAWWREARFGMSVTWGLFAIPAGTWGNQKNHDAAIRDTAQIAVRDYEALLAHWSPSRFDADAWTKAAADAGMKYVIATAKGPDGFCMFDSGHTDFDIGRTTDPRDVLGELAAACERRGLRFGTSYSIVDWHHPDYLPRRPWELAGRGAAGADFDRYEQYLMAQIVELVARYHPSVLRFDGEPEATWTAERAAKLLALCRSVAPDLLVDDRIAPLQDAAVPLGDFVTRDDDDRPGIDRESFATMNDFLAVHAADTIWKPTQELVRALIDAASRGRNFLLNVGPRADGTFPGEATQRLGEIGAWMRKNGGAIHGTVASPFDPIPWGRCTMKQRRDTTTLYFHVFDWPANGLLELPTFENEPIGEPRVVGTTRGDGDTGPLLLWPIDKSWRDATARLGLHGVARDAIATVIAVDVKGEVRAFRAPRLEAAADTFVDSLDVTITVPGGAGELRYTTDGSEPRFASPAPTTTSLHLDTTTTIRARTFRAGQPIGRITSRTFTKVAPVPAVKALPTADGLRVETFDVAWTNVPDDRTRFDAKSTSVAPIVGFTTNPGGSIALRFTGFVDVPADGTWDFALTSDDGSKLWIGGSLVVDNDGVHAVATKRGSIALAKGLHPIEVVWWNQTGDAALSLQWRTKNAPFAPVPGAAFRH